MARSAMAKVKVSLSQREVEVLQRVLRRDEKLRQQVLHGPNEFTDEEPFCLLEITERLFRIRWGKYRALGKPVGISRKDGHGDK